MPKPERARGKRQNSPFAVAFVAEPIGCCAADGRGQVIDNPVAEYRRRYRSLEICQRNGSKQTHAQPIVHRLHSLRMAAATGFGKHSAQGLAMLCLFLAASCSDPAPTGQVLARVDGEEITFRELQQDMEVVHVGSGSNQPDQSAIFGGLVDRKILVDEALGRGLEQDEAFHFALRLEREKLLVDALRRDIKSKLAPTNSAKLSALIASQPWRYRDRFVLSLAQPDSVGDTVTSTADSWNFKTRPPVAITNAAAGDIVEIEGQNWRVLARTSYPLLGEAAAISAKTELESTEIVKQIRLIVANKRQSGQIQFNDNFGPASR